MEDKDKINLSNRPKTCSHLNSCKACMDLNDKKLVIIRMNTCNRSNFFKILLMYAFNL